MRRIAPEYEICVAPVEWRCGFEVDAACTVCPNGHVPTGYKAMDRDTSTLDLFKRDLLREATLYKTKTDSGAGRHCPLTSSSSALPLS